MGGCWEEQGRKKTNETHKPLRMEKWDTLFPNQKKHIHFLCHFFHKFAAVSDYYRIFANHSFFVQDDMPKLPSHRSILLRLWRYFQLLGRPILRHGVFILFMTLLMAVTYSIVGEPRTRHLDFYVLQFVADLYVLCGIFCLLPHRPMRVLKLAVYGMSYTLCFVEAFLYRRFYLSFSPTMLNLVLETNDGEASEFLSSVMRSPQLPPTLLLYGSLLLANIIVGLWGHSCYVRLGRWLMRQRKSGIRLRHYAGRFMQSLVFPAAALLLLATTLIPWTKEKYKMLDFLWIQESTEAEKISGNVFYSPIHRIVYSLKFALIVRHDTELLASRMEALQETAGNRPDRQEEADIPADIVLIIGESYNKHHASCYGYPLATTPRADSLKKRGELTVFDDAVTPWNVTANAFKNMLSTHSADTPGRWTDGVLFPALMKNAGWQVAFITNQFYRSRRQNRSDFNGSFFLNHPRLDSLCFDYRNHRHYRHDAALVGEMAGIKPSKHNFYIFHLMGQHVMYDERFPENQAIFAAEDVERPDLTPEERAIVAAYDNATRYNDAVVMSIIRKFRKRDAIVVYLADHGDEVYDGSVGMFGRNHSASLTPEILRHEYEIPLMIWTSRTFRRRHPSTVERIREARHRPFASDDLPHLVLGLAQVATPFYTPERDLLSPYFLPRKRTIKGTAFYEDIMHEHRGREQGEDIGQHILPE